jgi:DNA-binding CsgD family transcriptional regulator
MALLGRDAETAVLNSLLARVGDRGAALVVLGEPGIGKSSLVEQAARRARAVGMRTLTCIGSTTETNLPFAGLHQLLRPVLAHAGALPAGQRDALLSALGMIDSPAPDLFRTALATLELLAVSAGQVPVMVIAEDVHWLDRSTCDVLAFVARRLEADPIVLVATCRDDEGTDNPIVAAGLPELRLAGLNAMNAPALLDARAPGLAPEVRQRLLDEAKGNPLALVELPVTARHLDEGAAMPAWLPLTTRLEQAFANRVLDLPPATRAMLLIIAINDGDAVAEVLAAAERVLGTNVGVGDLAQAVTQRLIDIDRDAGTIRLRHPLMRSAVYQLASVAERHAVTTALADVLADQPDRRAWHRAASTMGADEEVAAELEGAAARARRRGSMTVVAAALERAAQLSEDPGRRGERLLRAAEAAFELGRPDTVMRLLRVTEPLELAPPERTRLSWLRELFLVPSWTGADRVGAFVEIADQMRRDGDPDRALAALLTVALRCWWSNPDQHTRQLVVRAAEQVEVPEDDPRLITVLALASPVDHGKVVIERLRRLRTDDLEPAQLHLLGTAATGVGDFGQAVRFLTPAVAGLRAQGRLGLLVQALVSQAWTAFHLGNLSVGVPAAEEGYRLAVETDQWRWNAAAQAAAAALAARRGDAALAQSMAGRAEQLLLPVGAYPMLALVQLARGIAALVEGRHADAYEELRRIFDPADTPYHPLVRSWVLADLVDAAVQSGHHDAARAAVTELEPELAATGSPLLRTALCYSRALVAPEDEVEKVFHTSLRNDLGAWPFYQARLLLAHGTWLRRRRQLAESRQPLRTARDMFDALGAVAWGERARHDLRASGEASHRLAPDAFTSLTPQELQIAQLAASGMTNREIGDKLYLSHRTISSHLYRIFPKLGVTSRAALTAALTSRLPSPGRTSLA